MGECVGIDEAIKIITDASNMYDIPKAQQIINRLEYHRAQAEAVAGKVGGTVMLFNPVAKQIREACWP